MVQDRTSLLGEKKNDGVEGVAEEWGTGAYTNTVRGNELMNIQYYHDYGQH